MEIVQIRWLNKVHSKSWATLKKAILLIFKQFGSQYNINFSERIIKNTKILSSLILLNYSLNNVLNTLFNKFYDCFAS